MGGVPGIPRKEFFVDNEDGEPIRACLEVVEDASPPKFRLRIGGDVHTVEESVLEEVVRNARDSRLYLKGFARAQV